MESVQEFKPTPRVDIKKVGFLKGKLLTEGKEYKNDKGWVSFIYELAIVDTDLPVVMKGGVEASVEEGEKVCIFATKALHKQLEVFGTDVLVNIESLGKKDPKDQKSPYEFKVRMVKGGK